MRDHNAWLDRLRERLAAEGLTPSAHRETIDEIADHLNDLHRAAFATVGVPILEGRDFTHRDVTRGEQVTIVSKTMAERYWTDVRHFGLDSEAQREFYVPYSQSSWPVMTVVAKTVGEPMLWQSALSGVVKRVDPDLPVARVIAGIGGSLASGRLLQEFLYQVSPGDPQVIAIIVMLLIGVGLLASWLPARRAASIDPMVALRDE